MGKCISSSTKNKTSSFKQIHTYYKPKVNTGNLVACRVFEKSFKEIKLNFGSLFQSGCIFRKIDSFRYICLGGINNGDQAFMIDVINKRVDKIPSPPMSLCYGNAICISKCVYVLGSLVIEASGQEKPAPPLMFSLGSKKWEELQGLPVKLALFGSFCIGYDIYALGGYLNYPESPTHFREIIILNILTNTWMRSNIKTPIFQGLPACAVLSDNRVMIIGGHDPCECVSSQESLNAFLFNLNQFEQLADVPQIGQVRFEEEPAVYDNQVFLYSEDDIMFIYSLKAKEWGYIDYDQSVLNNVGNDMMEYKTIRTYLYRFVPADCEIVEYNVTFKTCRKTGPSSFKYTFEHTGMCLMEDGKLFFAGGLNENEIAQKATWILQPKKGACTNTADLPIPQYGLKILQYQSTLYAISGVTNDSFSTNHCQKFILSEDRWMTLPPMPISVFLPGASLSKDKIFAFGGKTSNEDSFYIQSLNLTNEDWEVLNIEYPFPVYGLGCATVDNGILCFGGQDLNDNPIPDAYFFIDNDFENVENLPEVEGENYLFIDPTVVSLGKVFAVSETGTVFAYYNSAWELVCF